MSFLASDEELFLGYSFHSVAVGEHCPSKEMAKSHPSTSTHIVLCKEWQTAAKVT